MPTSLQGFQFLIQLNKVYVVFFLFYYRLQTLHIISELCGIRKNVPGGFTRVITI
jgi:hypothetical protein